tara:strand:+ start:124 stop:564 length:441 start_codon:yes stop_codon:yes gene_type:complete
MNKATIHNLAELSQWVSTFLKDLSPRDTATIVTLSGDLGAGKTALVKKAAEFFGINETITSPTFVIQKEYEIQTPHSSFKKMVHIDAYRLESPSELEYLGWEVMIKDIETIIFLEWPEMVSGINLPSAINLKLLVQSDDARIIEVN